MANKLTNYGWYTLDYRGSVLAKGTTKENVLSDYAHYYIKHHYGNYEVFNNKFERTYLRHNNITVDQYKIDGSPFDVPSEQQTLKFFLVFRSSPISDNKTSKSFKGGIDAFKQCIDFMDDIGKFCTKKEWQYSKDIKRQKNKITELEAVIKDLESRLSTI